MGQRRMNPYYEDDLVTLWHGDCREVTAWLEADVLVTDPPYGIGWKIPTLAPSEHRGSYGSKAHAGILNDADTGARDEVLTLWTPRPAAVFGSPNMHSPRGVKQTLVWQKPSTCGVMGTVAGFRRDWEAIHLLGNFPASTPTASSVIRSSGNHISYIQDGMGHPHSKPVSVLELLMHRMPPGVVADPFAGSGSTLLAAKNLGRKAIGVELEERYCEIAAKRLTQDTLFGGAA